MGLLAAMGALLVGLPMCARDGGSTPPDPSGPAPSQHGVPTPEETAARAALATTPLGQVVSRDARGAARFIVGSTEETPAVVDVDAETAARIHLSRHAELLGLSEAVIRDISQTDFQKLRGGASVVQFAQRVNGIEVFRGRASVVLDASKNLVSIGANLHPLAAATHMVRAMVFPKSPESVVASMYSGNFGLSVQAGSVKDTGARGPDFRAYDVATPAGAPAVLDAAVKRVLFPDGEALVPAYYLEMTARDPVSKENDARAYVVAADGTRVLYETSLTQNDAFKYRVWADPSGNHIPTDGPFVDFSPNPIGFPSTALPDYAAPILVSQPGFNTNPSGQPDPWLAPTDTTAFGNNVRAYSDRSDQHNGIGDGFDPGIDIVPDVTAPMTFDRTYDVAQAPNASTEQIKAAATQLFYVDNWLHDYWYDSGFNEAAGVAQLSNLGRGGVEGDPLRAEAQDGADFGQINNANMSTPSDGISPRMQMFVWNGVPNRTVQTTPSTAYPDGFGAAIFGPQQFDLTAEAVLSNDGTGTTSDACEALTNVAGKIAVIDRGICTFTQKAENAQAAGAVGVLLINNVTGHAPVSPGVADPTVTIPLLGLSLEDGATLKSALAGGTVTAHIKRGSEVLHDGDLDNSVISHEWGHYLHHRLVSCGSLQCGGMSEGWADFDALLMVIRQSDLDNELFGTAFPLAQYAASGIEPRAAYFGIRRAPYSSNRAKNPFTFTHVRNSSPLPTGAPLRATSPLNSEVHNVGEIWAQTLFEGYVNLLHAGQVEGRTFEQSKRRMADYIVAGMKATPPEPTFTEQRDALLATVRAMGEKDDFLALARGFAKRGMGVAAVSPPIKSTTLDEAVENFDTVGSLAFIDAKVDDSVRSCDHDGVLDAGEKGKVTVRLRNVGWETLLGSTVSVSTTDPSVTFDNNGAATVQSVDPFGIATITVGVSVNQVPLARAVLPITIRTHNASAIPVDVTAGVDTLYNFDDVPRSSPIDNVESAHPAWTFGHGSPALVAWLRQGDVTNHVWHADDLGVAGDESLLSPDLVVGTGDFKITFSHRFQFETQPGVGAVPPVYFDGGVLELSTDGGTTWTDAATYTDPGYTQTLDPGGVNALRGRKAWASTSSGYPSFTTATIDLGTQFQGKTVKVRLRVGTDESGGAAGWDIDNIIVAGITNLPFASIVDDRTTCRPRN